MPELFLGFEYIGSTAFDQDIRQLAERIYGRYRARDALRVQAEVEILIADLKGAVLVWLGQGCGALAATAGAQSVPTGVQAVPVTFVAATGAPINPNL